MASKKKASKSKKAVEAAAPVVSSPVTTARVEHKPVPINLDVFRRTSGIRSEYFGGFERHITLEYGPGYGLYKTPAEWRSTYDQYLKRPVIG